MSKDEKSFKIRLVARILLNYFFKKLKEDDKDFDYQSIRMYFPFKYEGKDLTFNLRISVEDAV